MKSVGSNDFTSAVTVFPSTEKLPILPQTNWIGLPVSSSPARSSDQTTSSGVTGEPSCQVAPSRTFITILVRSSFQPHSVSRPGCSFRSGAWPIYWSNTDW